VDKVVEGVEGIGMGARVTRIDYMGFLYESGMFGRVRGKIDCRGF